MSYDYAAARKLAEKIITKFGEPGQVVKKGVSGGGFDQNGDAIPDSPDVEIPGTITPLVKFKTNEINGTTIQSGDSYVFFHSDISPEIDMQITMTDNSQVGSWYDYFFAPIIRRTFRIVDIIDLSSFDGVNISRRLTLRK